MTKEELRASLKEMPAGWFEAFGDMLCDELWDALVENGCTESFEIEEVKEKWGWLRVYFNEAPEIVYSILDKYEFISANTCIGCGKPDVGRVQVGKIEPICKECWDKEYTGSYSMMVPTGLIDVTTPDYYIRTWQKGHRDVDVTYNIKSTVAKVRARWYAKQAE